MSYLGHRGCLHEQVAPVPLPSRRKQRRGKLWSNVWFDTRADSYKHDISQTQRTKLLIKAVISAAQTNTGSKIISSQRGKQLYLDVSVIKRPRVSDLNHWQTWVKERYASVKRLRIHLLESRVKGADCTDKTGAVQIIINTGKTSTLKNKNNRELWKDCVAQLSI